jgi:hypothetical protein
MVHDQSAPPFGSPLNLHSILEYILGFEALSFKMPPLPTLVTNAEAAERSGREY